MNTAAKSQQSAVSSQPVFCTLMGISNGHLTKDVGLIPYGMYKYEGYDACNLNYTDDFPNLKKYVPGLRIELLPRRTGNYRIDSCLWLIKNAESLPYGYTLSVSGGILQAVQPERQNLL